MKRTPIVRRKKKAKGFQAVKIFGKPKIDKSKALYEIFKRHEHMKTIGQPRKRIKQLSASRAEGLGKYASAKAEHFKAHPNCQHPNGCCLSILHGDKMDLHHAAGRNGPLLYCSKYFRTACRYHHDLAKSEISDSRLIGWIIDVSSEEVRELRRQELMES